MIDEHQQQDTKYVIFDTDLGTDDAWALLMLLRADDDNKQSSAQQHHHNVKLLAITCVNGNGPLDSVAKNVLRILEIENRLSIPVYKGANEPLIPRGENLENFHGSDGFGDVLHETTPNMENVQQEHAVNAMYKIIKEKPKQVTLICVGPLTNIALGCKMYSDFHENIKDIYIMGGNLYGIGNITPSAEFNFFTDPEAAHIVLNTFKCPIVILPWEPCMQENIDISLTWRFEVLGNIKTKIMTLMNRVDRAVFVKPKESRYKFNPCDAILTAAYLYPDRVIKSFEKLNYINVELNGELTRGQCVLGRKKAAIITTDDDNPNNNNNIITIIKHCDSEWLKKILLWTAKHDDHDILY